MLPALEDKSDPVRVRHKYRQGHRLPDRPAPSSSSSLRSGTGKKDEKYRVSRIAATTLILARRMMRYGERG